MQKFNPRSAALTAFVHLMLFGLIWWGASWVQPKPAEVELWDAAGLAATQQTQTTTETATSVNETERLSVDQKETNTPAEIETKPDLKPKPQEVKPNQPVKSKEPQTKPITPAQKPTTDNSARADVLKNSNGTSAGSSNAGVGNFIGRLESAIARAGQNRGLSSITGTARVTVLPNGSVRVQSVTTNPADKAATVRQVLTAASASGPPPAVIGQTITVKIRIK